MRKNNRMTLDEAITRLEIFVRDASEVAPELLDDAIRLGIEALKRCQILSKNDTYWRARPLQGETEKKANATVIGSGYKPNSPDR